MKCEIFFIMISHEVMWIERVAALVANALKHSIRLLPTVTFRFLMDVAVCQATIGFFEGISLK